MLAALLDADASACRAALDERYDVLDDVLAGRQPAIVYPAAGLGKAVAEQLIAMGVDVKALGDRSPDLRNNVVDGVSVLSPFEVAAQYPEVPVLVASTMFDSVIAEDLRERGCRTVVPVGYLNLRLPDVFRSREYQGAHEAASDPANRWAIERAFSVFADEESRRTFLGKLAFYLTLEKRRLDEIKSDATIYFDPAIHALSDDEVFVDGGAYVGDTLKDFLDASQGRFAAYYAFEPDSASFQKLSAVAEQDPHRIFAVRAGVGAGAMSARITGTGGAGSRVMGENEQGGDAIEIVSLDEFFATHSLPTFIKLDIEGFEADALRGAAATIEEAHPVLAVSAYHYPTDLWNVPLQLAELCPGARVVLRHYTREIDDTVCYAIPASR
jgi:FkbM family methyltransferase